jgi:hypothetical protein
MHQAFEGLAKRLEDRSPINIDGTPFAISLIDIRELAPPGGPSLAVIVGAKSQSEMHTGELHLGRRRLDDLDYVEDAAIEVMKRIIHGDLPPGARELL